MAHAMILVMHKLSSRGFTLIEILVVTTIIAILASVVMIDLRGSQYEGRNAERKSELQVMQAALELYRKDHGQYPAGCNGGDELSGGPGSGYECTDSTQQFIIGLSPEYIPELPKDPLLDKNETFKGYVYITNDDQTVYKLMALNTAETSDPAQPPVVIDANPAVARNAEFGRCGDITKTQQLCYQVQSAASGGVLEDPPTYCSDDDTFAVFGGYADGNTNQEVEYNTERVICCEGNNSCN